MQNFYSLRFQEKRSLIPLKALRETEDIPYVTYGLIALNIMVFLWQLTLNDQQLAQAYMSAGVVPCQITQNWLSVNTIVDFTTSMFMHGGWLHLIFNMIFLAVFAPNVEDYMGKGGFLLFYMVAGFAASLLHTMVNWNVCLPAIGASGAIYGIMGAFFLVFPAVKISVVAFFFRIPVGLTNTQAFYMLLYFFVLDLFNGLASLGVDTVTIGGVAVWAHIGGFIAGLLIAFGVLIFKPAPKVDPLAYMD
jgi:membrane associated rhomboid family serine protease